MGEHFIDNPDNKPCINHIDSNPLNNHFLNLEWCTHQENMDHMHATGRAKRTKKWIENLHKSQEVGYRAVVATNIKTSNKIYFNSINFTKEQGFHPSCVCSCCNGIRKTHKGYTWRYADG